MQDQLYRDIILEHWKHPQNFGVLEDADIDIEENNPYCGDRIRLMVRVKGGKVADVAFSGEGCAISQASASLFTEEMRGKPLGELSKISSKNVIDLLGISLTPTRMKCALLIHKTLQKSIRA
jgi:nitrogen fixation NifU-like protein